MTTNALTVLPGPASQLIVTANPPTSITVDDPFGFTVAAEDRQGNLATGFSGQVTVALSNNPGDSTLGGIFTVLAVGGTATFSGLTLNQGGNAYTLQATSSGLSQATTNSFNVISAPQQPTPALPVSGNPPPSTVAPLPPSVSVMLPPLLIVAPAPANQLMTVIGSGGDGKPFPPSPLPPPPPRPSRAADQVWSDWSPDDRDSIDPVNDLVQSLAEGDELYLVGIDLGDDVVQKMASKPTLKVESIISTKIPEESKDSPVADNSGSDPGWFTWVELSLLALSLGSYLWIDQKRFRSAFRVLLRRTVW